MGEISCPIPVIDLSEESMNEAAGNGGIPRCNQVREAMEEFGCFFVVYGSDSEMMKRGRVFHLLKELFDLPIETKMKNVNSNPEIPSINGYNRLSEIHENANLFNATEPATIQSFAHLMWPSGNPNFCETFETYTKRLLELHNLITRMLFESYGIVDEEYYHSHINSMTYIMSLTGYKTSNKVDQEKEKFVGLRPHTDSDLISILDQNGVQGLEVKAKDGTWIPIHFPPSSFFVIASDALLVWSNGRISPCVHRVILEGKEDRYSIGMFSFLKGTVQIPHKLADHPHYPLKFKPFDHFAYIPFYKENKYLPAEERIKMFCGA